MDRDDKRNNLIPKHAWLKILLISATILVLILVTLLSFTHFFPSSSTHFYYDHIAGLITPEYQKLSDNVYSYKALSDIEKDLALYIVDIYTGAAPLYKNDYYIIITDEELTSNVDYTNGREIAATTNLAKKIITIRYWYLEYAIMHELGHAVDGEYGFSQSEEFQVLYKNIDNTVHWYFASDIGEYFAYCYDLYVKGNLDDPDVLEYFEKITKNDFYQ